MRQILQNAARIGAAFDVVRRQSVHHGGKNLAIIKDKKFRVAPVSCKIGDDLDGMKVGWAFLHERNVDEGKQEVRMPCNVKLSKKTNAREALYVKSKQMKTKCHLQHCLSP